MPKKRKEQKFFAIKWNDCGKVWFETFSQAIETAARLEGLARDDNQLILNETEAKKLVIYLIAEFLK